LRAELVERLGVQWQPIRRGASEIDGIPASVLREFSRRRSAIEQQLDQHHATSRGAAQHAALTTRLPKDLTVDLTDLLTDWHQRAAALRFGPEHLEQALHRPVREARSTVDEAGLAAGLTWDRSTFDRRDVLRGLAEQARAGAHTADLEIACDRFLASPSVVAVSETVWTTREMLGLEASIIRSALDRQAGGYGLANPDAALAAAELSDEQAAVVPARPTRCTPRCRPGPTPATRSSAPRSPPAPPTNSNAPPPCPPAPSRHSSSGSMATAPTWFAGT
jgi:hypothetical protein